MSRWIIAALTAGLVGGLIVWSEWRGHAMTACLDRGGRWDGMRGACAPSLRPILRRDDLRRS